jgi:hypothetical protein
MRHSFPPAAPRALMVDHMPDDLALSAISASSPPSPAQPSPTLALAPAAAPAAPASSDPGPFPSPVDHLDPALGIEVLQYLNQSGGVAESFPSQRQLDAYRDPAPASGSTVQAPGTIA